MAKKKFYVVWNGRKNGVFDNWEDCTKQVHGFQGAIFKAFPSKELAESAYNSSSKTFIGKDKKIFSELNEEQLLLIGKPIMDSISVDGAWNTSNGIVEYQGVETNSKKVLFKMGPFEDGTNNIVEFLGIIHALAYCKQKNILIPIYSDSLTAISWIRNKRIGTNHPKSERNSKLFELMDRGIKWLNENEYPNQILKWETKAWGENPADFGRK